MTSAGYCLDISAFLQPKIKGFFIKYHGDPLVVTISNCSESVILSLHLYSLAITSWLCLIGTVSTIFFQIPTLLYLPEYSPPWGLFFRLPLVKPLASELSSCARDYLCPISWPEHYPPYSSGSRAGEPISNPTTATVFSNHSHNHLCWSISSKKPITGLDTQAIPVRKHEMGSREVQESIRLWHRSDPFEGELEGRTCGGKT